MSSNRSLVLTKEKFDATVSRLMNSRDPVDTHLKHWIKTKGFGSVDTPEGQLVDALDVPNSAASNLKGDTLHLPDQLHVYDVTKQVHVDWCVHRSHFLMWFCPS